MDHTQASPYQIRDHFALSWESWSLALLLSLTLTACVTSDPNAINDNSGYLVVPSGMDESRRLVYPNPGEIPPMLAFSGHVLVAGDIPTPANRAVVQLFFVNAEGRQVQQAETTTGPDGKFSFSRKLQKGTYVLKAQRGNFLGEMRITDVTRPLENLVLEVRTRK